MSEIDAKAKMVEAKREVGYRRRVYARMVHEGRMKPHDAEVRIAIMDAIANDYAKLAEAEDAKTRLI